MIENQDTKILWDFNIRTDRVIEAKRLDIVVIGKNQETFITGVAIPVEAEKISKYQVLAMEIFRM